MVSLIDEAWLLFLLSLVVSLVLLPVVFVVSFAYGALCRKYENVPRVAWMFVCILVATLAILAFIELVAGSVIYTTAGALAA